MRPVPLVALTLALNLAGAAHAAGRAGAPTPMRMPPTQFQMAADSVVIPMRLEGGRIVVDVKIGGKGPFPFLFDTGAHGSVMDLAFAHELGLPLGPEVMVGSPGGAGRPGHIVTLDRLELGDLALEHVTCVAFDGLPFHGPDAPRGVLGPYGLAGLLVTLDYPRDRLVFSRGALPEPDGREVFAWAADQPLPEIPISVAGREIRVHLDSGATYGLTLPDSLEKVLPLAGPPLEIGHAREVDRTAVVRGAPLRGTVRIGRYTLENPTVAFSAVQKEAGNLGPPVLRQFALTIDPANRRLELRGPASGKLAAVRDAHPPR